MSNGTPRKHPLQVENSTCLPDLEKFVDQTNSFGRSVRKYPNSYFFKSKYQDISETPTWVCPENVYTYTSHNNCVFVNTFKPLCYETAKCIQPLLPYKYLIIVTMNKFHYQFHVSVLINISNDDFATPYRPVLGKLFLFDDNSCSFTWTSMMLCRNTSYKQICLIIGTFLNSFK